MQDYIYNNDILVSRRNTNVSLGDGFPSLMMAGSILILLNAIECFLLKGAIINMSTFINFSNNSFTIIASIYSILIAIPPSR